MLNASRERRDADHIPRHRHRERGGRGGRTAGTTPVYEAVPWNGGRREGHRTSAREGRCPERSKVAASSRRRGRGDVTRRRGGDRDIDGRTYGEGFKPSSFSFEQRDGVHPWRGGEGERVDG